MQPYGQSALEIELPESCELVGMEANDVPLKWQASDKQLVRVLLQPSYLPTRLRLLVRWHAQAQDESSSKLLLPKPRAVRTGPVLVGHQRGPETSPTVAQLHIQNYDRIAGEIAAGIQAQRWAETLYRAAPIAAGRGKQELIAWLPSWNPVWLGLDAASEVRVRRPSVSSRSTTDDEPAAEELQLPVMEFWLDFLNQHAIVNQVSADQDVKTTGWSIHRTHSVSEFEWYQLNDPQAAGADDRAHELMVELPYDQGTEAWIRYAVACVWIVLAWVLWRSSRGAMQRYYAAMAEALWPLWLALTLTCAALLPFGGRPVQLELAWPLC